MRKEGTGEVDRRRKYQLEHAQIGLCQSCSEPVEAGYKTYCAKHRRKGDGGSRKMRWTPERLLVFERLAEANFSPQEIANACTASVSAVRARLQEWKKRNG